MPPKRIYTVLFLALFLISLGLRLGLTLVNREANDDHMEVVRLILQTNRLPMKDDCWECFQPKLFHFTVATVLRSTGLAGAGLNPQTLAAQLINFLAGAITLGIAWIFIRMLPVGSELLRLAAFALTALNPKLIGISSQATNDAFVILFSTLALFFTFVFFQKWKVGHFLLSLLFSALAIVSKTNAWVIVLGILLALCVNAWVRTAQRIRSLAYTTAFMFGILVLTFVNPLTQYLPNYAQYGTPITLNIPQAPRPGFIQETGWYRPGILSIWDGFFTFKYASLLGHPRIEYVSAGYPAHRTSLWTALYASAHSVHFDNWPASWSTSGDDGFALSRGIFILALIPTFLLLIGAVLELAAVLKAAARKNQRAAHEQAFGLFGLAFIGSLAFMALYAFEYRDLSVMKAVFIFPALLSFSYLFLRAGEWLHSASARWLRRIFYGGLAACACLVVLYFLDVATLIVQVHAVPGG